MNTIAVDPGENLTGLVLLGDCREILEQITLDFRYLKGKPKTVKLTAIAAEFSSVFSAWEKFHPEVVAIEQEFIAKSSVSLRFRLNLDGVIALLAGQHGMELVECPVTSIRGFLFGPKRPKKSEVKMRVREVVRGLYDLSSTPPEDVADAFAVGAYHRTCFVCGKHKMCKVRLQGIEAVENCSHAFYMQVNDHLPGWVALQHPK